MWNLYFCNECQSRCLLGEGMRKYYQTRVDKKKSTKCFISANFYIESFNVCISNISLLCCPEVCSGRVGGKLINQFSWSAYTKINKIGDMIKIPYGHPTHIEYKIMLVKMLPAINIPAGVLLLRLDGWNLILSVAKFKRSQLHQN